MIVRYCKAHKKEIPNEDDNNGKYFCIICGAIPASRTYTDSVGSESAPQGENPVGGSVPNEIEVTGWSVIKVFTEFKFHGTKLSEWVVENRADKVFMVRKAVQ